MKNTLRLFTVFAAALFLAACVAGCSTPWGTAKRNVENSRNLRVGMTKNEVLEVMGEPIRDEKFCEPDLWFYYIEMVWGDGLVTPEECMPLIFEDGKLIGWGNDFYLDHQIKRRKEDPGADLAKAEEAKKAAAETATEADKKTAAETVKPEADKKPAAEPVKPEADKKAAAETVKPEADKKPPAEPAKSGAEKPQDHAGTSDPGKK